VVADATALARNLYLALQVIETGLPTVLGLSMMDEVQDQSLKIDIRRLSQRLGVEVVPLVASKGDGIGELRRALQRALDRDAPPRPPVLAFSEALVADLVPVETAVAEWLGDRTAPARRAWALWAVVSIGDDELVGIPEGLRDVVTKLHRRASEAGRDLDLEVIETRYRWIDELLGSSVASAGPRPQGRTERIDAILTHRVAGLLAFSLVMLLVFEVLFSWAEPAIGFIEARVGELQGLTTALLPTGALTDLLVQGVIGGVGNVIVFVPQIALLFLFIALLEDSGYLARVALVIDRIMGRVGLNGKAFVPMLSGFACAVPAVLATRTIESRRDRLLTMLALPLMSCSARLPIYVLVTATVFDPQLKLAGIITVGAAVLLSMYLLSVAASLCAAAVLRRTILAGPRPAFLLELPPYRLPVWRNLVSSTWQQVKTFLKDAGTVILAMTVLLWALLSYPKDEALAARYQAQRSEASLLAPSGETAERLAAIDSQEAGEQLRRSFAGRLGRLMEPAIEPLGFDWRIGIGILGAFAAREVFVSTLGVVFDISDADEKNEPLREALGRARRQDGSRLMTPLTGVSLMVFFVLACQCMSTLAVVRRESGSWKWPVFMFGYMTLLAYLASLLVYQVGRGLGWGLGG